MTLIAKRKSVMRGETAVQIQKRELIEQSIKGDQMGKLSITEEELAVRLIAVCAENGQRLSLQGAQDAARRMLAADTLYDAGSRMLRIADATDCDEPMTEQFYG